MNDTLDRQRKSPVNIMLQQTNTSKRGASNDLNVLKPTDRYERLVTGEMSPIHGSVNKMADDDDLQRALTKQTMVNQGSFVKEQFAVLPDLGSQISLTSSNVHMINNGQADSMTTDGVVILQQI